MQSPKYEFYINETRVYPHYTQLKKKYELESDQRFFRIKLDGTLKLFGSDYYVVRTASIETELVFKIYTAINNTRTLYFEGTFNKVDCKFDDDAKSVELSISPRDSYTDILNNYEDEYNLVELAPRLVNVNIRKRPVLQIYTYGESKVANFMGGTFWETDIDEAPYNVAEITGVNNGVTSHNPTGFSVAAISYDIVILEGKYAGIYAGDGSATILSYSNDAIYFKPEGIVYIDIETGLPDFSHIILTCYNKAGTAIYTGNCSGNNRLMTVTFTNTNGESFSASVTIYYTFSRYLMPLSSCNIPQEDGSWQVVSCVTLATDDFAIGDLNYKYAYEYKLENGQHVQAANLTDKSTKYGKAENGQYFNQPLPTTSHYFPIARSAWDYSSSWYKPNEMTESIEWINTWQGTTLKDGVTIGEAIKALLTKVAPDIEHEESTEFSEFLYSDANPITGDKLIPIITQKSNVLTSTYDQAAAKVPITLKSIFEMLRDCFRCYWFIEDNKLKIEHISYFMNGRSYTNIPSVSYDLSTLVDVRNSKTFNFGQNSFSYDTNDLNGRYEFSWADDCTDAYNGKAIDINAKYVQEDKTDSISISDFSTDIDLMLLEPSNFSKDGFALLICNSYEYIEDAPADSYYNMPFYEGQGVTFVDERGTEYTIYVQNLFGTWWYLERFYMFDMPASNISYDDLPNGYLQVSGLKRCMEQTVQIPLKTGIADPDVLGLITTTFGQGEVEGLSINLVSRQAEFMLSFEPK